MSKFLIAICSDSEKSSNKVILSKEGPNSIYFKVLPRYKFRQEGEKVLYRDQIILLNVKTSLYLHQLESPYKKSKDPDEINGNQTGKGDSKFKIIFRHF